MAKVNKKPFHCIPLAVLPTMAIQHCRQRFERERRKKKQGFRANQLAWFEAPDRKSRNRDGSFIKDQLRFIFCPPSPLPARLSISSLFPPQTSQEASASSRGRSPERAATSISPARPTGTCTRRCHGGGSTAQKAR